MLFNFIGTKASPFVSCVIEWETDFSVFVERKLFWKQGGKTQYYPVQKTRLGVALLSKAHEKQEDEKFHLKFISRRSQSNLI